MTKSPVLDTYIWFSMTICPIVRHVLSNQELSACHLALSIVDNSIWSLPLSCQMSSLVQQSILYINQPLRYNLNLLKPPRRTCANTGHTKKMPEKDQQNCLMSFKMAATVCTPLKRSKIFQTPVPLYQQIRALSPALKSLLT